MLKKLIWQAKQFLVPFPSPESLAYTIYTFWYDLQMHGLIAEKVNIDPNKETIDGGSNENNLDIPTYVRRGIWINGSKSSDDTGNDGNTSPNGKSS